MGSLDGLFANSRARANQRVAADPDFFTRFARQQLPKYLWTDSSDSRVPANEIQGLGPDEVFVHRNTTNVVFETRKVEHVMVVGDYGRGGVQAVAERRSTGR